MMSGPELVGQKPSTADTVRAAILRGELNPGQWLVEVDLSERYSVARASVREALVQLEAEGLVERQRNRGARVRVVSIEEAMEIMEARAALEGLCAARAASRVTASDTDALRRLGEEMRAAVNAGDILTYSALSEDLHDRLRQFSDQKALFRVLDQLRNQSVRFHFEITLLPGYPARSVKEHDEVIEAVSSGDPDLAEEVMRRHLLSVKAALADLRNVPSRR
jgi:DNA-binding GntR family transcriptional regulator